MATYTKQDIENLKTRIRAELPALVQANPGESTGQLETLYCDANPVLVDQFGMTKSKHNWSVVQVKVYDCIQELKKSGELITHKRGYYHPDFDLTTIPAKKAKKAKAKKVEPVVETVVEPTLEVEETQEVEETHVPVEVDNPAVIEAHIDTTTNELVENVGGSKDYRISLDKVEDGYITSSVQVSTTTLEPVAEQEQEPVEVEVEVAPVEPVEVQEVVEPTLEIELPVEGNMETQEVEKDTQPSYDLRELRKSASFDPIEMTLNEVKGSYEVYRDMVARNIVLTQKKREDYVIIPVDIDQDRLDALNQIDGRYTRYALKAVRLFETEKNHKDGCLFHVKALISCTHKCDHTDDFGGLVEPCMKPLDCPLQSIWGGVAIYVNKLYHKYNPQDS